jgi:hypothetical protein
MPSTTLLEMPLEEQAQMRAVLRRTRYGYLRNRTGGENGNYATAGAF